MNPLQQALHWLLDPASWSGPAGIGVRLAEHVNISLLAIAVAALLAMPVGLYIGHFRRFELLAVSIANVGRAIPSFGIIGLVYPFTLRYLPGIGYWPTLIALILLAIPPILTNTYVGVKDVEPGVVEAARGVGMGERSVLRRVELPLSAPLILAGVRTAAVQVVATATLGAVVGWDGLGRYIVDGFARQDPALLIGGALLVAGLAVATELAFGLMARLLRVSAPRTEVGERPPLLQPAS